jgi:hypothetical protein
MLKTFIFSFLSYLYLGVLTLFPDLLVIERMFPNCRQPNLDMVVPLQFHLHLTKLCTQFSVVSPPSSQWTRLLYSKAQTCGQVPRIFGRSGKGANTVMIDWGF